VRIADHSGQWTWKANISLVFLHDNERPYKAARTQALLGHSNWELFGHPPYNPDLALSDYHLFTYLKNLLTSQCFKNTEELMDGVKTRLSSQAADFFDTSTQELFFILIEVRLSLLALRPLLAYCTSPK
jgi:hypothetical protein